MALISHVRKMYYVWEKALIEKQAKEAKELHGGLTSRVALAIVFTNYSPLSDEKEYERLWNSKVNKLTP